MLIPIMTKHYLQDKQIIVDSDHPQATEQNKVVLIQLLTKFIDTFNYLPVKVNKLRYKNDSNEFTYIMSSGKYGSKNDRGEVVFQQTTKKSKEELHLLKLLALVSNKIQERFTSLK